MARTAGVRGNVSIHAPARGATRDGSPTSGPNWVSIHAPRGGRPRARSIDGHMHSVSIHAPARGATWRLAGSRARFERFNPRPREGGDPSTLVVSPGQKAFQSTPPRGGRRLCSNAWRK